MNTLSRFIRLSNLVAPPGPEKSNDSDETEDEKKLSASLERAAGKVTG